MMNIREFQYVLVIAQEKSISSAAKRLFISQPALSRALLKIEDDLGVELFTRRNRTYIPTYVGEMYVNTARKVLEECHAFESFLHQYKNSERGVVRLGITPGRGHTLLPSLVPAFYQSFPNFSLEIHEENVETLEQYLKEDKIDLALCTILSESVFEKRRESLQVQVLSQEAIVLCVPKSSSWSLIAQTRDGFPHPWIDLKLFSREHFLLLKNNTRLGSLSRQILAQYNMEVTSTTFSIIHTILELIGHGYGVAFAGDFRLMDNAYAGNLDIFSVGDRPIAWEFVALCGSRQMRRPQINYIINYVKNTSGASTENRQGS